MKYLFGTAIENNQTLEPWTSDCRLGEWLAWGSCTVSCGGGTQVSVRTVKQQPLKCGSDCVGELTRQQYCSSNGCPGMSTHG